jgi:AraC family transcriptional activator of pobA
MKIKDFNTFGNFYESNFDFAHYKIYIESISDIILNFGENIKPHIHRQLYQFFLFENDGGICDINGNSNEFFDRSIIIIPNNTIHGIKFNPKTEGFAISIESDLFRDIFINTIDLFKFFTEPKIINNPPYPVFITLKHLAKNIFKEINNKSLFSNRLIKNFLEIFIINIYRNLADNNNIIFNESLKVVKIFNEFKELLNQHKNKLNDMGFFTDNLKITMRKLNEVCKLMTGKSALGIINDQIINDAKIYLIYTDLTIYEITNKLYFSTQNYFTRFFKKHTGLTPTEFRKISKIEK